MQYIDQVLCLEVDNMRISSELNIFRKIVVQSAGVGIEFVSWIITSNLLSWFIMFNKHKTGQLK